MAHRSRPLAHAALLAVLTLTAAACSGDDASDGDTATEDTADATEIPASSTAGSDGTTTAGGTGTGGANTVSTGATNGTDATTGGTPTSAGPGTTAPPAPTAPTAAAVSETTVSLKEWSLTAGATTLKAGSVTFNVKNDGQQTHEFVVIKGTYETMPQSNIGAVLEDQLPAGAVIGRIDSLRSGETGVLSADLAAGPYALLCNIASGPNSHAGKGQRQNITIA